MKGAQSLIAEQAPGWTWSIPTGELAPLASEAQIAANIRNATRSTGPKTDEGKGRVRGNALKHGMFALTIVPFSLQGDPGNWKSGPRRGRTMCNRGPSSSTTWSATRRG